MEMKTSQVMASDCTRARDKRAWLKSGGSSLFNFWVARCQFPALLFQNVVKIRWCCVGVSRYHVNRNIILLLKFGCLTFLTVAGRCQIRYRYCQGLLVLQGRSIFKNPWKFEQFFAQNNNYFIINGFVDIKNCALFEDFIWETTENWNLIFFQQCFF